MSGFFIEIFKFKFHLIFIVILVQINEDFIYLKINFRLFYNNTVIYIFNNIETKNMDDIIEKCLLIKSRL